MTIYVTRHGQSMTNIDADLTAAFPINIHNNILTETGIEQAKDFAKLLKEKEIHLDAIVASPYARTKQTAFTIASVLGTCVPISFNKKFQEIEWDVGGKFDRLENYIPGFDSKNLGVSEKPMIDHRRGAFTLESQEDVYNRAIPAFINLAKRARKKNILLVTHFFVVRAIEAFANHGDAQRMLDYSPKNLCFCEYDYADLEARINA